ncbi:GntR family transcriptional regulator [Verticiella sediminum]|uniref:GntR family transcriptional regulator n=1 Tax=Verticiella sediminum TaxID=1247510 RepID=A0A556AWP5_9BURK|nr:GntR family transcriptional regulator [Verticiella sediminum]TSH97336.1 GntR family transcriptional regulator [Verticiella sediminum]
MKAGTQSTTLNGAVYETLRQQVLTGKLQPRQRLKVASLAATNGVSLNVIREALNRLVGEGLVHMEPQVGFTVQGLSADDLEDLVRLRIELESHALRQCIARGGVEWQADVLAAHHRLHRTPLVLPDDPDTLNSQWLERHDMFHAVMLQACGSPRLYRMVRQLAAAAEMYHRALLPVVSRDEEMEAEHQDLLDAILASDADRAVQTLAMHLEKTRDVMLPMLRKEDGVVQRATRALPQ